MNRMAIIQNWFLWAFLSAVFAALTAIFAKVGLESVDSDLEKRGSARGLQSPSIH